MIEYAFCSWNVKTDFNSSNIYKIYESLNLKHVKGSWWSGG